MGRNIALTIQTVGMTACCRSRFSGLSCNESGDRDDGLVQGPAQFNGSVRPLVMNLRHRAIHTAHQLELVGRWRSADKLIGCKTVNAMQRGADVYALAGDIGH